jgi:CRISPR-associated protein Csm4
MATFTRVLLASNAPYHFGVRGVGLNETDIALPADSLFSAFCNAYALAKGAAALQRLLERFPVWDQRTTQPPFRITSLMPTAACRNGQGGETTIELVPMPLLRPRMATQSVERRKDFKRITWVSTGVFGPLAAGAILNEGSDLVYLVDGNLIPYTVQDGEVWVTKTECDDLGGETATLWKTDIRPRVTVDRMSSASTAFSSGGLFLSHTDRFKVSLYALIRWDNADDALQQEIAQVFEVLGESGIGGERAYGYGAFAPIFSPYTAAPGAASGDYFTTLSPYLPQAEERAVFDAQARYEIVLRRGWITAPGYSNLRRPTIRMIQTGAVLRRLPNGEATGALADATPEILRDGTLTIYRYGLAWPVSIAAAALADDAGAGD